MNKVLFSNKSDEWTTPQNLFDKLNQQYHFTLDPCCTHDTAKCNKYFTMEEDGLSKDWSGDVVFMNPPYSQVSVWMEKAYWSAKEGATVVCLIPSRTDTRWWHSFAMEGEITFIKGRLRFGSSINNAPFPSAIVVFRGRKSTYLSMENK